MSSYIRIRVAQWLSTHLPPSVAFRCAEQLADVRCLSASRDREAVRGNLSLILGEPVAPCAPLVRDVFRNFGRYLVEFFNFHHVQHPRVTTQGYEHLEAAIRQQRGTILLTGHLGNWEAGAVLVRRMGFPMAVVALSHENPRVDRLFVAQRQRCGIEVIPIGQRATQHSLRSLKRRHMLGVLGDRDFTGHGVEVSFCGQLVTLPSGPAVLSLRSGAPIVPTFVIREGPWSFRLCFEPPIWPAASSRLREAVPHMVQAYAQVIERFVRRFPSQWIMFRPLGAPHG